MGFRVLNPTLEVGAEPARLASRLGSLAGRRLGLLDNGKFNVARFYDYAEEVLRREFSVAEFVRRKKPDLSRPVPPGILAELSGCDAILSGVGD
jgi:hypothetical protein